MQAQEIQYKLKLLIEEASTVDNNLSKRLGEINRWVKDIKAGKLIAKPFLKLFLEQMIRDADAFLILKSLSLEEQQLALNSLTPTLKYWYGYLFPKWLSESDPKFYIWRQKIKAGEFSQEDGKLIESITKSITNLGGTVVQRYIIDLSMATDIIVSSTQEQPLCIQLTSLNQQFSQDKSNDWENTLRLWAIDRGLFLSYNPISNNLVSQIVNISLAHSDNLLTDNYLKLNM
ncbi:hypothetical protein [Anabaena sp. UHCC 0399]|uniref:hypothetical protein n=1 Tax=Anabaena sp. UHCC 0399 TaxID=3110238 RepID=UPI002B212F94|nr:hypothetical protein [Anabaena sp. UHCC 0399]MEA5566950.1 hypothetical protein [Anabaena sp. UHCC 0399]